jgi:uncharacterized ion transporter superfamily protein YfcC
VGYSLTRQIRIFRQRRKFRVLQRRKKKPSFSTRRGLILVVGIATFVALVFILVYYVWYLPIERSMQ